MVKRIYGKPKFDKDYIIILGSKIRDNGYLTPILQARVDKAIEFAKNQKENQIKELFLFHQEEKEKTK